MSALQYVSVAGRRRRARHELNTASAGEGAVAMAASFFSQGTRERESGIKARGKGTETEREELWFYKVPLAGSYAHR